jgi:ribosomal protein RSM22 (predicted rRNA methylase)
MDQALVNTLLDKVPLSELRREQEKLSTLYRERSGAPLPALRSDLQRLAYLCARYPATQAALRAVFQELQRACPQRACPGAAPLSLLDVGAGPGTALLAARECGLPIERATLCERDAGFIALGKQLCDNAQWIEGDITRSVPPDPHDLVVASYVLNEVEEGKRDRLIEQLWARTGQFLVLVDAGSPAGYALLMHLREQLIARGAHLIAPCPHARQCPLPSGEWCHFAARLARTSVHRKLKGGSLGYEDEKFSYLIFSREPAASPLPRVLCRPRRSKGCVQLQLCSKQGLEERCVTKKQADYKAAKQAEWGSALRVQSRH